jgi:hypothetical protein
MTESKVSDLPSERNTDQHLEAFPCRLKMNSQGNDWKLIMWETEH